MCNWRAAARHAGAAGSTRTNTSTTGAPGNSASCITTSPSGLTTIRGGSQSRIRWTRPVPRFRPTSRRPSSINHSRSCRSCPITTTIPSAGIPLQASRSKGMRKRVIKYLSPLPGLMLVIALISSGAAVAQAQDANELQGIEKQLNGLGDRIQRLQDLSDVEIVQDAYGYYVDKAQWHYLADLFAPDATLEIGGKGIFLGRARVFEYMHVGLGPIGPRDGSLIDHQQFQCLPTINVDGVTAQIRCIAFVMSSGGWGHNYYEDKFVKINGCLLYTSDAADDLLC